MNGRDETVGWANKSSTEQATLEHLLDALLEALAARPAGDPDLLSAPEVAAALRCSEDTVRRIPRAALPAYRVGKANLYFREDVLAFVRSKSVTCDCTADENGDAGTQIDQLITDVLESPRFVVRASSERRA